MADGEQYQANPHADSWQLLLESAHRRTKHVECRLFLRFRCKVLLATKCQHDGAKHKEHVRAGVQPRRAASVRLQAFA
uniref:hypothetical protein n=1 Tax=Edaphobacter sp. 4G125 TaxID=2763071 RepID=UPI00351CAC6B